MESVIDYSLEQLKVSRMTKGQITCPEVCIDCESGQHVFHVIDELGSIYVQERIDTVKGKEISKFTIHGHAEGGDFFWLRRIFLLAAATIGEDSV